MKFSKLAIALACSSVFATAAHANIDTTPTWDGASSINPFGVSSTATYGQTFTTGAMNTVLQSFSFFLSPLNVDFYAGVGVWDGASKKISSVLFESGNMNIGNNFSGFQEVAVGTGNLQLAANTQYVAYFSTSGIQSASGTNQWGYLRDDVYSGGNMVWFNNGNDKSALTSQPWDGNPGWFGKPNDDLAFKATLAPVPEPETYGMMLAGLAVLGAVARRRKAVA
ncbi:MAG: PEP-CTERM sorting domain-containing protein [Sterolibacterium sp.]|jgi:hypothetical protein|nr:PEP-CTERM sorting domain-containing protein [Sterolibacterium sp.]